MLSLALTQCFLGLLRNLSNWCLFHSLAVSHTHDVTASCQMYLLKSVANLHDLCSVSNFLTCDLFFILYLQQSPKPIAVNASVFLCNCIAAHHSSQSNKVNISTHECNCGYKYSDADTYTPHNLIKLAGNRRIHSVISTIVGTLSVPSLPQHMTCSWDHLHAWNLWLAL